MKLGIVSDIHGNVLGLRLPLAGMGPVDELLCLGDSIYEYQFSNEVIAMLRDLGAHVIQGNHEEVFLSDEGIRARERDWVDQSLVAWLADQPHRRMLEIAGKKLLMVHSTPWNPRGEYIFPHNPKLAHFADTEADFVLYGHTHAQVVRQIGRVTVINPGSAGDARDTSNGRLLSCAVLETDTHAVEIINYMETCEAVAD